MTTTAEPVTSRERILSAATELFAERGYEATSTRTIAERVGLNIATVAYHVGGKPDLYREVVRRGRRGRWTPTITGAARKADRAARRYGAACRAAE